MAVIEGYTRSLDHGSYKDHLNLAARESSQILAKAASTESALRAEAAMAAFRPSNTFKTLNTKTPKP